MTADKVRENRLRRAAERQGLRLVKSRRRDPRALDYGRWEILNGDGRPVTDGLTLDDVEAYLHGDPQ